MPVTKGEYKAEPDEHHPGKWKVVNTVTGKVHAKGTTKDAADHQERLLFAVAHGWKPTHS